MPPLQPARPCLPHLLALLALSQAPACGDKAAEPPADLSDCSAADGPGEAPDIVSLALDGDTLTIELSYGGGCESHQLALCWPEQAFMEEDPVQVRLEVWHDDGGDTCEAYLDDTLVVDLSPLKTAWQEGYGAESGTVVLLVGGQSVDYSF